MTVIDLTKRNTQSKMIPEIDSLYVYSTRHTVKFTHRHQKGVGYQYSNHNAIFRANQDEIHIYHRTATINGVTQGLTMITKNSKVREVQKWFKEQVEAIEKDEALFEKFKAASQTPTKLDLNYTY